MGFLKNFFDGYRDTDEEKRREEQLQIKEELGYSPVRQFNEWRREGVLPTFFKKVRRGLKNVLLPNRMDKDD